jgi:dolichol-phosphate mannosyltransferase
MIEVLEDIGRKFKNYRSEILIIDDNSPDGTPLIVEKYKKKLSNIHLLTKKKEGLGKALILGYEYAIRKLHADIVIPNDADFQWDPYDIPKLLEKIEEGFDVVVASRHIPGGKVVGWNWFRKLNHDISNSLLAWFVAGVHEVRDHAGNFKAIRVDGILDQVPLSKMKNVGFSFQLHILYELSKTKAKFTEVPVTFKERRFGQSKIGFNRYYLRDVVEYIKSSIIIRMDRSDSFFKYLIVGGTGFIIQTIVSKILISLWVSPGMSVAFGAEGAIISNYMLNNLWTFSHKKITGGRLLKKFLQFNMSSVAAIAIQWIAVGLGTYFFGRNTWFIFMVASIIFLVIPFNYFIYNRYIWKTHSK